MRLLLLVCAFAMATAWPVRAQDATQPPPAYISFADGTATIDHDGESEAVALNMPVLEGDRIRTENGRVDITFPDGSSIAIDAYSDVELLNGGRTRVLAGAIEHRPAPPVDPRSASAQYLPPNLQSYDQTFDQNGSWQYEQPYGYVWYPTVAADWRPYYYGYWSPVPRYGLTWIGVDRWSWPTHHYGRWGYSRSRWYWIPGRTWATAWVSWGTAPDYVSWCPLGYDGQPVIGLSIGYRSAWNAWTVVPRARFATGRYWANRYAVEPYRLASTTPFVIHRSAPTTRPGRVVAVGPSRDDRGAGVAVPRYGDQRGPATGYRNVDRDGRDGRNDGGRDRQRPIVVNPRDANRDTVVTTPGRRDPNADRRGTPVERAQPITPPAATTDHPAYRPSYTPTYTPNYDPTPRYRQPNADAQPRGGAVDRHPGYYRQPNNDGARPSGDNGGRAERRGQSREAAPSAPSRPAPAASGNGPASSAGVRGAPRDNGGGGGGQRDGGGAHARSPRSEGGSSSGTAVRRPR